VLVGAAQLVQRDAEPAQALDPLAMLERVARDAAADAGAGERALRELDTIGVVDVVAWRARNPAQLLGDALGAHPARHWATAVGGEMPIALLDRIAREIAQGRVRVALAAGCNNVRSLRRARRERVKLDWRTGGESDPERVGVNRPGSSEREKEHGLAMPPDVYPVFENALRARRGLDFEAHRRRVGALMSRFSEVAAKNPYAWYPVARSPDEITRPSPRNRMIAFPYTKYMNAVIETDQAAAVLAMSEDAARALGVPEDRWVYWWGGARAEEQAWFASERPDMAACPALRDAASGALAQAGVGLDEIDHIDFYSCFPVAVEMACEMLGLEESDPRGFTVTGGLPYAGGPGNNYTLHSLAAMMQRLRAEPGSKGLVTGNGWYLTKHSACVLATAPREPGRAAPALAAPALERAPHPLAEDVSGPGTIEAWTVTFDRDGAPARGIVIGSAADGRRFLANTPDDRALLEDFVARGDVGRAGTLETRDGRTLFDPA
jgi:acetyl-CoA C-acetyltransferase